MPLIDALGSPPKMTLVNMTTNEVLEAQFNPTEFEETLGANWAKQTVPGLSHQVKQFIHTEDVAYSFDLYFHATDGGPAGLERIHTARRFLHAVCHPKGSQGLVHGGAPRVLFIWPNMISLSCVVTSLKFKFSKENIEGTPVAFTVSVSLEEIRDVNVSMEDISAGGTQRSGSASQGGDS